MVPDERWWSWPVVAGYLVAGVILWAVVRNAEWPVLVGGLRSLGWPVLAVAIVIRIAALLVSALRWQLLLEPVCRVRLRSVAMATMMGMAVSAVVSMQAAEIARPYWLSNRTDAGFAATGATVAVEWCLDLIAVLAFVIPMGGLAASGHADSASLKAAVGLLMVPAAALAGLAWIPRGLTELGGRMHDSGFAAQGAGRTVVCQLERFVVGLRILNSPRGLALVGGYSLLTSFLTAMSAWLALRAFGLPVPFLGGFVVLGLITIGGMTPTPGALGGFHAVCQVGLAAMLELDATRTLMPVIGLHSVLYAPPAVIGACCLLWDRAARKRKPG